MRFSHGDVRPDLRLLQHDSDSLPEVRAGALRVVAEHADLTGVAAAVALEDLDGRRLPGAVGAEQAEHLALLDLEIDAANCLEISVRLAQAANGDCAQTRSSSTTTCPQGGNGGSGPPASPATALPQSG